MVLGSVVLFPSLYGGLCSMCYFVQEFSFCWDVCYGNFCYTMEIVCSCAVFLFVFLLSYLKQQTLLRHWMCDSGKSFFINLCWTSCIKVLNEFYGNP